MDKLTLIAALIAAYYAVRNQMPYVIKQRISENDGVIVNDYEVTANFVEHYTKIISFAGPVCYERICGKNIPINVFLSQQTGSKTMRITFYPPSSGGSVFSSFFSKLLSRLPILILASNSARSLFLWK